MENLFNPDDWMPSEENKPRASASTPPAGNNLEAVENAIAALEQSGTDITQGYARWRSIGFAFSEEFGEAGRSLFHRVSRMNPDYNDRECDQQYSHCLRSTGSGITIASFFWLLKEAGISPEKPSPEPVSPGEQADQDLPLLEIPEDTRQDSTPVFPGEIYSALPAFLDKALQKTDDPQERDIMLLGILAVTSACLGNFYGFYLKHLVYPNFYFFLTGRASAGKGNLRYCRTLVSPIHYQMKEESRIRKKLYEEELQAFNEAKQKGEKPREPKEKLLFLPANSSSTGFLQLLHDNDGKGLIYETEGDTLSLILRSDFGDYSDTLRKAFHHEPISYFRRTDREHVEIEHPQLSTVLSGTPRQILSLVRDAENGLFSRFMYYFLNTPSVWKDTFSDDGENLDTYFRELGADFFTFYQDLQELGPIRVNLTQDQKDSFFTHFSEALLKYLVLLGEDYEATVKRMGLVAYRIMMILTAFRLMEWKEARQQIVTCSDSDYRTAIAMVKVLLKHGAYVFSRLPLEKEVPSRQLPKMKLLAQLNPEFLSSEFIKAAGFLKISQRTAERYIAEFVRSRLVIRIRKGLYQKLEP